MTKPYEPKPATDAEGKPRFNTKTFLEETVRLADRTTREVMFIAHAGKAKPKQLCELADAYRHAANRLSQVAEDLSFKAKEAEAAAGESNDG